MRAESLASFAAHGGKPCDTPAQLGTLCDVVITFVVNADQTDAVLFGKRDEGGAASTMRACSVVVASATVPPAYAIALGKKLAQRGIGLIDSPVSGGVTGVANGTLSLLASGPDSAFKACEDVLQAIASKVYRLGQAHGIGSKVKVINQLLVGVQIAAAAEAMALGLREGRRSVATVRRHHAQRGQFVGIR